MIFRQKKGEKRFCGNVILCYLYPVIGVLPQVLHLQNFAKMPKTNLFAASVKIKETAKKPEKKFVKAPLGNKIERFLEVKEKIKAATSELKMLEGDIKAVGKDLFLKEYRAQKSTPDNFFLQDEVGSSAMLIVQDKYTIVDENKAEVLKGFPGLLQENVVYKMNTELVEKYGEIISGLIMKCKQIPDEDKANLISGELSYSVAKGSIDRIMQYENPEQVFELINPVVALK